MRTGSCDDSYFKGALIGSVERADQKEVERLLPMVSDEKIIEKAEDIISQKIRENPHKYTLYATRMNEISRILSNRLWEKKDAAWENTFFSMPAVQKVIQDFNKES